nr:SMC-Scp complex subunit ScpB [Bilifractor porci]
MQDIGKEEQETAETEVSEQGVQEVPGTTPQDGTEPVADRARRDPSWNEEGAIEAILFAMGDSVELNRLASAIGLSAAETKKILDRLKEKYNRPESGIRLLELDSSYQLCTKKQYYGNLIILAKQPKKPQLTDVVMETLSIIAYKQPVTKAEIEKIRGVSSEHAINKLLEYELIQELGRLNIPGRPILFGTTEKFLRCFGVESTDELPVLDEVQIEDFKAEAEAELDVHVDV